MRGTRAICVRVWVGGGGCGVVWMAVEALTSRKRAQPTGRLVCSRKPSLKAGGGGEEALEPLRWRRSSLCCPLQGGMGLQQHGPGLGPGAALVVASREADLAQLPCPIARPASFGDEVHHAEGRLSSLACRDAARAVEICVGPLAPCSEREKGKGKGRLAILVGNLQSGCRPWVPGVSQRLGASPGNTLLRKSPRRPLSLHQRCPLSLPALPASLQDPDQYSNLSFSVGESILSCLEQKRCLRGSLRPLLLTPPVCPVAETDRTLDDLVITIPSIPRGATTQNSETTKRIASDLPQLLLLPPSKPSGPSPVARFQPIHPPEASSSSLSCNAGYHSFNGRQPSLDRPPRHRLRVGPPQANSSHTVHHS